MRVNDLVPNKKYKIITFLNNLGQGVVTVESPIILDKNISKLYEVNYTLDGKTETVKVSKNTLFEEVK